MTTVMDPEKRIKDLEREVSKLRGVVRQLLHEHVQTPNSDGGVSHVERRRTPVHLREPALIQSLRERVSGVLHGDGDEAIETRIGTVWLSRLAVLVIMTAFALAARATLYSNEIEPAAKLLAGYAAAACLILAGTYLRSRYAAYAQALLAGGLASLYFTTYAACFLAQVRVPALGNPALAFPLLAGCLLAFAWAAQATRSQAVAGVGVFLAYYTVALSATGNPAIAEFFYAMAACALLAATMLMVFAVNGWTFLSWASVAGAYTAYALFFSDGPAQASPDAPLRFWAPAGFLSVVYLLFCAGAVFDSRRGTAMLALLNTIAYYLFMSSALGKAYPEYLWHFRAALAAVLTGFACILAASGPRRHYLYQLYAVKAAVLLALAIEARFSAPVIAVALAAESLVLAAAFRLTGVVAYKAIASLLLLVITFAAVFAVRFTGLVAIARVPVPAPWFAAVGVAVLFVLCARLFDYERATAPYAAKRGPLLFGGTFLDIQPGTLTTLYATAAALVVLAVTVTEASGTPFLPYLLGVEAACMAGAGLLLRARPVEAASALLLAAAHVSFHVFLALPLPGFRQQAHFEAFTAALALYTFLGAFFWERYLRRLGEVDWSHHVTAAVPYLAATLMLAMLCGQTLPAFQAPSAQAALGVLLLLAGYLIRLPMLKTSGVFALGFGLLGFYQTLYGAPDVARGLFPLPFLALFGCLVAAERVQFLFQRDATPARQVWNGLRSTLAAVIAVTGILGIHAWKERHMLILGLLLAAVVLMLLGLLFRESRYRWAALFFFAVTVARAFTLTRDLSPLEQVITFGASGMVLLAVSGVYSRVRTRHQAGSAGAGNKGAPRDESP